MSNETKRDVFNDLLEDLADAHIALDGEGIGEELTDEDKQAYLRDYDAALPDDLPTIPLAVSEEIKGSYGSLSLRDELDTADSTSDDPSVIDYIENSESVFAEAWCRGLWIVKETGEVTGYDEQ
ncbi:hypothetical protein L3C06_09200 [Lacticaseibacillus paracasei subsp. paracasei]|uniref:hypothetical protein n=1 Tax=Lacticaseibacillus paracasei TaxID=1597 RepID=UPI001F42EF33|nr:hypothetical protein [Lacticaseibacillus paracasei]UJS06789.1 hypothetical protein L3C06_09200 [Lacticaseibacillus paracasei subsp. paracasei]